VTVVFSIRPVGQARLSQVAIPSEHGGWSLTLEPVLLGLIVAPSVAGVALGAAALLSFLFRTPLKLALVDTWRRRRLPRTEMAAWTAAVYGALLAIMLAFAGVRGQPSLWQPLLIALPMFAAALIYDVRSRSRRLTPEILGTIGIGSVVASMVLAVGGSASLAYGLWVIVSARAVAAVPLVRFQVRRAKGQSARVAGSDVAQGTAALIAVLGVAFTDVPAAAAVAIGGLALFGIVSARMAVPRVAVIGAQQVVLGLTVVLITGLSAIAP
jgi:hypothetical protein